MPVSRFHIGGVVQTHAAPAAAILRARRSTAFACASGIETSASLAPSVTMTRAGRSDSQLSSLASYAHVVVYALVVPLEIYVAPAVRNRGRRFCWNAASTNESPMCKTHAGFVRLGGPVSECGGLTCVPLQSLTATTRVSRA